MKYKGILIIQKSLSGNCGGNGWRITPVNSFLPYTYFQPFQSIYTTFSSKRFKQMLTFYTYTSLSIMRLLIHIHLITLFYTNRKIKYSIYRSYNFRNHNLIWTLHTFLPPIAVDNYCVQESRRSAPSKGAMTRWPLHLIVLLIVAAAARSAIVAAQSHHPPILTTAITTTTTTTTTSSKSTAAHHWSPPSINYKRTNLTVGYLTAIKEMKDRQGLAISGALTMALDEVSAAFRVVYCASPKYIY